MMTKKVTVKIPHIYPKKPDSCIFAEMSEFDSYISVEKDGLKLSKENSLTDFFKLDIKDGSEITIIADGTDEQQAVNVLSELLTENYYLDIW